MAFPTCPLLKVRHSWTEQNMPPAQHLSSCFSSNMLVKELDIGITVALLWTLKRSGRVG